MSEFKFSYAKQKQNRQQFEQMAKIIEQYRLGFDELGKQLYSKYAGDYIPHSDKGPSVRGPNQDVPLAVRLQVDRNTQDTYESSWAERKAKMAPPPPPPPPGSPEAQDNMELVLLELHTYFQCPELLD